MRALLVPALLSLSCSQLALAAQQLPSYLNSNDVERNLPTPNLPVDAYRPSTPELQVPEPQPSQLQMGSKVMVRNIQVAGGSVYSLNDVAAIFQPLVGREASIGELISATRSITQRYQDDGYLLSYAYLPPQSFNEGVVRVVLVEGYVKNYQLSGDIGAVSNYVRKLLDKIQGERPLTRKTFERYTTLLTMIPGVSVGAQVPPPGTTDGATTLIAQASRKPWTSSMNLSDSSRDDIQAILSGSSNAQTAMAEQITVSGLFPPGEDEERYYRLDYSQFLGSEGTQLSLYGSTYKSEPHDRLRLDNGIELTRKRQNDRYSIGLSHPLIAAPDQLWTAGARLYAVNDQSQFDVVGFPLSIDNDTDIRVLGLETDWRQADSQRLRILSAGLYQGIDGMGANTDNTLYDLDFLRLRLSGVQSDQYWANWQGVISAAVYWTDDNLPDAETVVLGAQNFGRGYPSDQASGDKGWGASYELNYSYRRESEWLRLLQPYIAVDAARSWYNDSPLPTSQLSSAALGLRFGDARYYNISVEAAKPMSDVALDSNNRRPRLTFSFSYQL
ncbi:MULTISPECIES: ShlB/FhaC/HecB family hemolysin secretion/activation protein [Pseudomonas]|uniref:Hemolysin activation/secretion protein n=1 Tax=Pseudomonas segetis TaxID=298908 RepID=A0A239DBH1_9PSED|nr:MULTISPECIES: POTRA domain-containing protein [Pseudomonas]SNS29746.1 Hemolysin activation/secretion protein [Pseudomonas segetis]